MRKIKFIVSILVVVMLCLSFTSVYASASNSQSGVVPRYVDCSCGGRMLPYYEETTHLFTGTTRVCIHGDTTKLDYLYEYMVISGLKCTRCGRADITSTDTLEWVCMR